MRLRREHNGAVERVAIYMIAASTMILTALIGRCMMPASAQESPSPMVATSNAANTFPQAGGEAAASPGKQERNLFHEQAGAGREVSYAELLALACFAEASYSKADCAAIAGVIKRRAARAGVDEATMLRSYSAVDRLTRVPSGAKWVELQAYARRIVDGAEPDACAPATHWGGTSGNHPALRRDRERMARAVQSGRWRIVRCAEPTKNTFAVEVTR